MKYLVESCVIKSWLCRFFYCWFTCSAKINLISIMKFYVSIIVDDSETFYPQKIFAAALEFSNLLRWYIEQECFWQLNIFYCKQVVHYIYDFEICVFFRNKFKILKLFEYTTCYIINKWDTAIEDIQHYEKFRALFLIVFSFYGNICWIQESFSIPFIT